jgi:TolB-like protein/Flp pilus assembly protein TadD
LNNLFLELKRRNIFRVAAVYSVIGWLVAQMASVLESAMNMPTWFDTMVVSCLLLGFPIAMILAWAFEMTPEGVKRTNSIPDGESVVTKTGRSLDLVLVTSLVLVGALIIGDRLMPNNSTDNTATSVDAKKSNFGGQSIAVLPFEDFSPSKDQAYFADGIAEELLNVLARVEGLRVASRTSAFSFKARESSISEIAKELKVGHILEGSVRKAADTLRITAQLIDTKTDEHMWSETYDRPLTAENIFKIQDEISQAIVLELNGRLDLLPETSDRPTQSTEAFDAYLKGKEAFVARTTQAINKSIDWLDRAITLDPNFAEAHAKLARVYALQKEYSTLGQEHSVFRSKTHIDRAMELAPDQWEVLSDRAWANYASNYGKAGLANFDAAIAANPNNAHAHRGRGLVLDHIGRLDEAMASFNRVRELDPKLAIVLVNMTGNAEDMDDIDGMQSLLIEALSIDPDFHLALGGLARSQYVRGHIKNAHRIAMSCRGNSYCDDQLASLYANLGMDAAVAEIDRKAWNIYLAHKIGNSEKAKGLTLDISRGNPRYKLSLWDQIKMPELAYLSFQQDSEAFSFLFDEHELQGTFALNTLFALAWSLEQMGDSRANELMVKLEKQFDDIEPGTANFEEPYLLGARWQIQKNRPEKAMAWLNALADRGVASTVVQSEPHWMLPLIDRADYQGFKQRMLNIAARDRAIIEEQLANPPDIWWSPGELTEVLGNDEQVTNDIQGGNE